MGKESLIAEYLQRGASPRQLVADGFSKSTVYKVAEQLRSQQSAAPTPPIVVQASTDRDRYLPGESAFLSFTLTNRSTADLYAFQAGVRPEWLAPTDWIPVVVRRLLTPMQTMAVRIAVQIPDSLTLGEKDVFFGVQGQWLGPQSTSPSNELMWISGLVLCVQRPRIGAKVFIAHSVGDLTLVRQFARTLEDSGITAILPDPGAEVSVDLVKDTDLLVGIVSNPAGLGEALQVIEQAHAYAKDVLLVRDATMAPLIPTMLVGLPWADVNFALGPASVMAQVAHYVTETLTSRAGARKQQRDDLVGALILGLAALAASVAIAKGRTSAA